MKKLYLMLVMMLCFAAGADAQNGIFYVPIRSKESVSIGLGSAKKASDSLLLDIGLRTDTLKKGVRLDSPRSDTGRAYKLPGAIKWNRGDKAYYYYNDTAWKKMGL